MLALLAALQSVSTEAPGLMLDGPSVLRPRAAYSFEKISTASVNCITLQRASDNAQLTVGFDSNGDLDETAIATHCGASIGLVRRWYDQSGNGNHLVQTTASNMFQIYDGTQVRKKNGKPALYAPDQTSGLVTDPLSASYTGTDATAFCVGAISSQTATNSPRYVSLLPTTTTLGDVDAIGAVMVARHQATQQWGMNRNRTWPVTVDAIYNQLHQVTAEVKNATYTLSVDNAAASATYTGATTFDVKRIGVGHTGFTVQSSQDAYIAEVIVYLEALTVSQKAAIEHSQWLRFSITPTSTQPDPVSVDWDALGYESIYDEEFTTSHSHVISGTTYANTVDSTHWTIYGVPAGTTPGNEGIGFRNPENVKVAEDTLRIIANGNISGGLAKKNVDASNRKYSGGEIRFRIPPGQGYNAKVSLFPTSGNWPADGEITLFEIPGGMSDGELHSTVRVGAQTASTTLIGDWTQWHTLGWVWDATKIVLYLDGTEYWRVTDLALQPRTALQLVAVYDVGDGDPILLRNASTPQPSVFEIDRIQILRLPAPDPGGSGLTDLPGWNLIFNDNFDTPAAEGEFLTKYPTWGAYSRQALDTYGGEKNSDGTFKRPLAQRSHYEPNILSVSPSADGVTGNCLKMRLHVGTAAIADAPADGRPWGAAPFPKLPGKNSCRQKYGRYEAKFRVVGPVQGWKTAWLLWNTRNDLPKTDPQYLSWPPAGETDFPEGQLTGVIHAFHHRYNGTSGGDQDHFSTAVTYTGWHIAVIEWKPNFCRFILDGVIIGTVTSRVVPDEMRWVLQTETSLGNPRPITGQQCIVEIAYVGVWSYNP